MAIRGDGPPEDGRKWVRADEAAKRVGLTQNYFGVMARKWEITRYCPLRKNAHCWYLEEEIESWAEFKRLRKRWRARHRPGLPRLTEAISLEDARRLCITTEEAAAILGVKPITVQQMVRHGRLVCYQHRPGQVGSRLWFSRRAVIALRDDPKRLQCRESYRRAQEQGRQRQASPKPASGKPLHRGTIPEGWLTTRQAAERLGVSPDRVRVMRAIGRLRGEQLWRKYRPLRGWYFLEGDVEALKADPGYQEFRARYLARHDPARYEAAEAERLKKLAEWTLHVNGWDDPWHEFAYQAAPDGGW